MFTRIVFVANDIDRLGGVSSFVNTLSEEFHGRGFDVELVGVSPSPEEHFQRVERSHAIATHTLMPEIIPADWTINARLSQRADVRRRLRHRKRFALRKVAVDKLREKLTVWGPETVIIITQVYGMEHLLEAGYNASDPTMPRVIGQYHGSWDGARRAGRDLPRVVTAYRDVDATVFLTPEYARAFRASGLNNVHAIANPVVSKSARVPIENRSKKIVALARYDVEKSLHYLIHAWQLVADTHPDWSVELYGEGPQRDTLQALIDDQAIPRATLTGKTDNPAAVYDDSRINVLCSQFEGMPLSIIESAIHGVPSVAFNVSSGVAAVIDDGLTGTLVEPNSTRALATALDDLMSDEAKQREYSKNAVELGKRHAPAAIADEWIELFKYMES